ncbi:tetratricopeptide repeat protein [Sphingomonas sp. SUN019]|uniref:SPOR domain-containing protein n=1 Tax=Sphingomonas sp. SUN019 TaxID=2937788 RepID=UPI002164DC9B|nr:tetratricopeptide repeat protein [Sphingomonas sp. SUN019]UVO52364.1 tetratricopeptide repeat protein [Sphingomonas sp. SUN019]
MKTRAIATLGLSALVFGGTMVGCTHDGGIASASSRSEGAAIKHAAANAGKANNALAKGDAIRAVSFAEAAVAMRPNEIAYRTLLGNAYLKAGRFSSAHTAFADVLTLSPGNGKAALNMALAQIAEGQWDQARQTVETHSASIAPSDRGLALALAGDPAAGVEVLIAATRSDQADTKTRQNLALALALAGRWKDSRSILGVDLEPVLADKRIVEWAAFAQPTGAADQVAALLGVVPVKDPGLPVALALNAPAPVALAAAEPAVPVEAPVGTAAVDAAPSTPAETVSAAPVVASAATPGFAPRSEVVQPLPARAEPVQVATIAATGRFKTKLAAVTAAPRQPAKGNYYVQLGAYDSVAVAKDAWMRAKRRFAGYGDLTPTGMPIKTETGQFYRLSVGGFARNDAAALCRSYSARGGTCFVRTGAGDQVAQWIKPGVQLASR